MTTGRQTAMFTGVHAPGEDHANRGMSFEKDLNLKHAEYERDKVAQIHKQYVPALPVKDGRWAKVIGKSTVDYVGQLSGGRFVAFDAKDCAGKRIDLERLQPHQLTFLKLADALGGLSFVLTRFERARVYVIPIRAWRWAVEAHRAGHSIYVEELDWTATGKNSLNEKEMKDEWRVEGCDWEKTVRAWATQN